MLNSNNNNYSSPPYGAKNDAGGSSDPTLMRTTSAAKSDEARVFQHASQFAHHVYLASEVNVPVLSSDALLHGDAATTDGVGASSVAGSGSGEKQQQQQTGQAKPSDAELQRRDDEALAIRLSLAAHTLVSWSKSQPLAGSRSSNVRNEDALRSMEALHLDESRNSDNYVGGSAFALLSKGATLTDEAGDRVLSADNDTLYILSADDERMFLFCCCSCFNYWRRRRCWQ